MSAYDITGFLRTAYQPFAYCVPSKHPLNTAYQKGGCHPLLMLASYLDATTADRSVIINGRKLAFSTIQLAQHRCGRKLMYMMLLVVTVVQFII